MGETLGPSPEELGLTGEGVKKSSGLPGRTEALVQENIYQTEKQKFVRDFLREREGIEPKALAGLSSEGRKDIKRHIQSVYGHPDVVNIIQNRGIGPVTAEETKVVRDAIGLEKWHSLSEAVSYVRTLLGETPAAERKEKYERHVALGVDANEFKKTLSQVNDVMPARIDTDIKHQSHLFYRATVEVISNALDASLNGKSPIGRFGIGFYQILNHLRGKGDRLAVRTRAAGEERGTKIEFKGSNGDIDFRILPDESISKSGTIIELKSRQFKEAEGDKIIREYFTHTQDARIKINGKKLEHWQPKHTTDKAAHKQLPDIDIKMHDGTFVVADSGTGMSPAVIFEKLLVPKLSGKPSVYELRERGQLVSPEVFWDDRDEKSELETEYNSGEVILQVGGITIEKLKADGFNMVKTLSIDLPASTMLGEQRNEISVDHNTIESLKQVIDKVVALPKPECFEVLNALGSACAQLQKRSQLFSENDNLLAYLHNNVREKFSGMHFLPNERQFMELDLEGQDIHLLDPRIFQSNIKSNPALDKVAEWWSPKNMPLYKAKFKDGSKLGVMGNENYLILDSRINVAENIEVTNRILELASYRDSGELIKEQGQESTDLGTLRSQEAREYRELKSLVGDQWKTLYFGSQEDAVKRARQLEGFSPEITKAFSEKIFSGLPAGSVMEAWNLMEWYTTKDGRPLESKMLEIEGISKNLHALMSNRTVREAMETNMIPLFSMFEPIQAQRPQHIRNKWNQLEGVFDINDKRYYVIERGGYESRYQQTGSKLLVSEDGEEITVGQKNAAVLFRDRRITITKDKAVDTQTGEALQLPIKTVLGEFIDKEHPHEISVTEINKVTGEAVGLRATPKEVFPTDLGGTLIVESNHNLGHPDDHGIERLVDYYLEPGANEEVRITDSSGQIIWQFSEKTDGDRWGNKVIGSRLGENNTYHDNRIVSATNAINPRVVLLPREKALKADDPIAKVVRYIFPDGGQRYREIIGYISADGREHRIEEATEINSVTLEAKFAPPDQTCACCDAYVSFSAGWKDFPSGESNLDKLRETIGFNISGDFQFDLADNKWVAPAFKEGESYWAIFNDTGEFERAEKRKYLAEPDYRYQQKYSDGLQDKRLYYAQRGSLRAKGKYENSRDVRNLVTNEFGQRVLHELTTKDYGESFLPIMVERNRQSDGILDARRGILNADQVSALGDFISRHPVPDQRKLESLFYRVLQTRELEARDLKMLLPAYYELEDLQPTHFSPQVVSELRKLSNLDAERFTQLTHMLDRILPESEEERPVVAAKLVKFYSEKLLHNPPSATIEMLRDLRRIGNYKNHVAVDGFAIIKYGTEVNANEIPRSIRPLVTFMQRSESELATTGIETIQPPESAPSTLKLSEVVQWKRLRETQARSFSGDPEALKEAVTGATSSKTREHIVREITHAVHFQALNSADLYVRELVQNAVDALETQNVPVEQRNIDVALSVDDKGALTTSFSDPVGMDIKQLVNYFLSPGETTKKDKKSIGYYGQGVYTLFKDAERVDVKTSIGDGNAWFMRMKPLYERDMVVDVEIDFYSSRESFKGTTISKRQKTENPYIEAAYVRDSLMTLTSALDAKRAPIRLQGELINQPYRPLQTEKMGELGEITLYSNPNNVVTQHGLYVKEIGDEYWNLVPGFMQGSLKEWGGVVVDLPKGVELTRSRQDIANKDQVSKELDPVVQKVFVQGYIKRFLEKFKEDPNVFPFKKLPYDYFTDERYFIPEAYQADADRLLKGNDMLRVKDYANENNALKLMTLLPMLKVDERQMSLDSLRMALQKNDFPFDQEGWRQKLPYDLAEMMSKKQEELAEIRGVKERAAKEFQLDDRGLADILKDKPPEISDWLNSNSEELERLEAVSKSFIKSVTPAYHPDKQEVPLTFFYSADSVIAHASRFSPQIGWNMYGLQRPWRSALTSLKEFREGKEAGKVESLLEPLGTLAHEMSHTTESFDAWSHDQNHEKHQARVLAQFLIRDGMKDFIQEAQRGLVQGTKKKT